MEVGEKLMAAQLSHEPIHLFYTLHTHHPFPLLYHTLFIPCTSPHLSPSLPSFMAPTSQAEAHTNGDSKAQQESQQRETKGRHQGVGHKSLLQTDDLFQYILDTSVYPREHQALRGLRAMTAKHRWNLMTCPADEGQFLNLLVKLINAKNTMEIGVYTGYSLLSTALALPDYGKIIAMDIHRQNYELGVPFLKEAGVYHKIDFREGAALSQLDEMLKDESKHGFFDFIFVDADKDNYLNYHERLIKLVKPGGLIGYDNTLWNGAVAAPEEVVESYPKYVKYYLPFVMELNKVLAADQRIEISQLPVGDGLTLCRRLN